MSKTDKSGIGDLYVEKVGTCEREGSVLIAPNIRLLRRLWKAPNIRLEGKMIRGTVWFHRLSIAASYRDAVKIPWIPWLLRMGSIIGAMYKTGLITHTIR